MTHRTLLSIGHGYSAAALGDLLIAEGWRVIGVTRSADKAGALRARGVEPLLWDGADWDTALDATDHLLISAAPDAGGDPVLRAIGERIAARAAALRWAGYLSTVGVYGDHGGAWIDESAPLNPATDRGRARVAAEDAWRGLRRERDLPLHVFRLAGIYGPGRGPFARIRSGEARRVIKAGQVFSRIHVDDIAAALRASISRPDPGAVYNVCDDLPAPPQDVLAFAADLLGAPRPPEVAFETAELSPMARSFYAESKRVANRRIREALGVDLRYPTYREGLAAVLAAETARDRGDR
jgi:nucleoside-diphosphate-sugar epimerase